MPTITDLTPGAVYYSEHYDVSPGGVSAPKVHRGIIHRGIILWAGIIEHGKHRITFVVVQDQETPATWIAAEDGPTTNVVPLPIPVGHRRFMQQRGNWTPAEAWKDVGIGLNIDDADRHPTAHEDRVYEEITRPTSGKTWEETIGGLLAKRGTRREILNEFEAGSDDDGGEAAMLAGMTHGIRAYNEARGNDSYTPEPCGHQCDLDCPRCGDHY